MEKQKCPEVRFKEFDQDWKELKLLDVIFYKNGKSHEANVVDKGAYVIVNSKFVSTNGLIRKFCHNQIEPLNKNDIAFVLSDVPNGRALSKTFLIEHDNFYTLNQRIAGLKPKEDFESNFLQRRIDRHPYFLKFDDGVGQTNLSLSDMQEFSTWYPSNGEQTQIGHFFQNLDQSIALHEKKLAQTQNLKKAMLEKMFPKTGSTQPEIRLKGFSGDWQVQCIGDFTRVGSGARVHKEKWTSSGVPFYRSSDVVSSYKGNDNSKAYISFSLFEKLIQISGRLERDDLLVTGGGSIGIPYLVPNNEPLYSKDADLIWIKKSAKFNSQYLYTFFSTSYFRSFIASISHIGTIAHYTIEQVKATPVCLPSIEEQIQIGNFFKQLDETLALQQQQLQTLKNLKQAFLEKMFV